MDKKPTYDELAAHVARLREALITVNRILHDDCFTVAMPTKDYIELALSTCPTQSLNYIKAQVEEETIERCREHLDDTNMLDDIPRKYREQSNED